MTQLQPSMRLKVKGDTFFLSGADGSVYVRNNEGSFRMEGNSVAKWVDQLVPALDGSTTLEEMTDGLPDSYRERVCEIVGVLLQNGYLRDVSQDMPHGLSEELVQRHASQIEFLDMLGGSGAARFEAYRQAKVLVVGAGPFFVSLVASLLDSGLPKLNLLLTDAVPTNRERLAELAAHAQQTDSEVELLDVKTGTWRDVVQAYDWILYVSQAADVQELLALQNACLEEKKAFFPAVCVKQTGLAGPLAHPDGQGRWESVWHRLHQTALCQDAALHDVSPTAGALLANVAVFELFKTITGVAPLQNTFFLLHLDTLEGNWHWFLPHPRVTGLATATCLADVEQQLAREADRSEGDHTFSYFSWLTSAEAGVFHRWEEGDLMQLPLAQCRVQAADPLSTGPAELLPEIVCSSLTHEAARVQAGYTGIEAYVSRLIELEGVIQAVGAEEFVGVGTGVSVAEAVGRGLQKCLAKEFFRQQQDQALVVRAVQLGAVEDELCNDYLQALTTIHGAPAIGLGEDVCGFPVVWVGAGDVWYGSTGLNLTFALEKALQQALTKAQNDAGRTTSLSDQVLEMPFVTVDVKETLDLQIPACDLTAPHVIVQSALQTLAAQGKRPLVFDLGLEPFLREVLAGVFGVVLREEESR